MRNKSRLHAVILGLVPLVGCQGPFPWASAPTGAPAAPAGQAGRAPVFAIDMTPRTLLEPAGADWTSQHVTGRRIQESRRDHAARLGAEAARQRKLLAFSAPSASWQAGGTDGIPLTTVDGAGGLANDWMPNAPAAVYFTAGSPAVVRNKMFFLSSGGKLVRCSQDRTDVSTLSLGRTFSRTMVTISPAGGRAYLLSDDGYFFVVNTATTPMTVQSFNMGVTGNQGLAPVFDPYTSHAADLGDDVYVPLASGLIRKYRVTRDTNATTPPIVAQQGGDHNAGGTLWGALKASPIVLGGNVFLGDQSGNIVRYNAGTSAVISTVSLGYPVNAPVALNIDDAGTITDLFVNVGARCAWITYDGAGTATSTNISRPLYLDEGDTDDSGFLSTWTYAATTQKYWIPAQQALTINADDNCITPPGMTGVASSQWLTWASAGVQAQGARVNIAVGTNANAIICDRVAGTGHIWITSRGSNNVKKYDSSGNLLGTYTTGSNPSSVAIDTSGNAWVTNEADNTVRKMSSTGSLIGTYTVGSQPTDVAIDASGNVWVTNWGSNSVTKMTSTGSKLGTYTVGTKPKSLAIDASGNVWVANHDSDNVTKMTSTGSKLGTYSVGARPYSVAIDSSGNAWVASYNADQLRKFSSTGSVIGTYSTGNNPSAVAVDPSTGVAYVANWGDSDYRKFTNGGIALADVAAGTNPSAIEVDLTGKVWCVGWGSNNVSTFTAGSDGPVYGYVRWDLASSYLPSSSVVAGLKVWIKSQAASSSHGNPPSLRSTSHLHTGSEYWTTGTGTSTDMTCTNEPTVVNFGGTAFGVATANTDGWGTLTHGREAWGTDKWYGLRVVSPPTSLSSDYAIALCDDTTTDDVAVWPAGAYTEDSGNSPTQMKKYAPRFYIDPTQAGNPQGMVTASTITMPASGTTSSQPAGTTYFDSQVTPLLEVEAAGKALPSVSLETAPIIDAFGARKYVYVVSTNTVFQLDFSSTTNWADAAGGVTKYVVTRMGDSANGVAYGPTFPPSTAPASTRYLNAIEHRTAGLLNYTGTYLYVLNRYPGDTASSPASYKYALSKIAVGASGIRSDGLKGDDPAVGSSPGNYEEFTPGGSTSNSARDASAYMIQDFFTYGSGTDHIWFGLPASGTNTGYVYQLNQ